SLEQPAVDGLQLRHTLLDRDAHDVGSAQRDHLPEVARVRGVDRLDPEPRRDHAVIRVRGAAAENVAERRHARLVTGAVFDLVGEALTDPPETNVTEVVDLARL